MKVYKKKLKNDLHDIQCDICKCSCKTVLGDYEYASLSAIWGYTSKKDGEVCDIEICENCFDKIINFIESLKS